VTVAGRDPEEWRLTLAGSLEEIPRAQAGVGAILRARAVPQRVVDDCLLIVEEVVANVVTHAYRADTARCLYLDVQVAEDAPVRLRFADDGPAFDPLATPPPDLDAPIDERPVGGLGVWLVRQLAAHCEYARENGQNVLTVTCR
jgi:anti-sigma regulatory factor (Ser/Thr protein kinase)